MLLWLPEAGESPDADGDDDVDDDDDDADDHDDDDDDNDNGFPRRQLTRSGKRGVI